MKLLVIIFCLFLSASAELSPQKLILFNLRLAMRGNEDPTRTAMDDCLIRKMKLSNVELSEDEMEEGLQMIQKLDLTESEKTFQLRMNKVIFVGFQLCELQIDSTRNEKIKANLLKSKENAENDESLECYKSELKRLKPDHEMVKDFELYPECEVKTLKDSQAKDAARDFNELKITKCTLEEYVKPDNPNVLRALEVEVILTLITSDKSIEEIGFFVRNEYTKLFGLRLKCLLNQIYDR